MDSDKTVQRTVAKLLALGVLALLAAAPVRAAVDPPDGWRIQLQASSAALADGGSLALGASSAGLDGFDAFDDPQPPAWPSRALDLVTVHDANEPGWEAQPFASMRYRRQFDAPLGPVSRALDFTLETDVPGTVTLSWLIAADLDLAQHFATLTDLATGTSVDLWATGQYTFAAAGGAHAFRIDLTPGRSAPPVAQAQSVSVPEDGALAITLLAVDAEGDPLTYAIVQPPQHGTLLGTPPVVTYVPAPDFNGTDLFTFVASDAGSTSNEAPVTVIVTPVNDAPVALDGAAATPEDTSVGVTLAAADVDGDTLAYEIVTPPAHGTLAGTPPSLTYTPAPDYFGADAFTFRADDGQALSNTAVVTLTVTPVNDAPVADFTVPGPERNVALWRNNAASFFAGANVVAVSSDSGASFVAQNALDDNVSTRWASASGQPTDQFFTLLLPGGALHTLRAFRLVNANGTGGQSVRHFEVRVSTTTADDAAFTTVLADQALDNNRVQEFDLPAPVQARYVQFRALDTHGTVCCVSLRSFEAIAPDGPGVPSEFAWPANAAALSELAQVAAFSSQAGPSTRPDLAFDGSTGTRWQTASGAVANQFVTVELGRGKVYPIDRVRLWNDGAGANTGARNFRIDVSTTTPDDAAFVTVFSGEAASVTTQQEFVFPGGAVSARYVRFTALDNWGSACCVSVSELQVLTVPTSATSYSSYNDYNSRPEALLDGSPSTAWVSASGQVTNQFVKLRLAPVAGVDALIDRVRVQPWTGATTDALRDFEVAVSTGGDDDADFTTVLSATAQIVNQLQEFVFPGGPVRARYVRLRALSNHGSPTFMRVSTFEVGTVGSEGNVISLPAPAVNLARNGSPSQPANGAVVVRSSGSGDANSTPLAMLDYTFGVPWRTAGLANQYAVVQLAGGQSWMLQGVQISPRLDCCTNESVKDFEVWVSDSTSDDAAFTLALSGTVLNNAGLQSFDFPGGPAAARFVKYVPLTNYGSASYISTTFFDVRAPEAAGVVASTGQATFSERPEAALDGNTGSVWRTPTGTNHRVKISLGAAARSLYGVRIHPVGGAGPRGYEVRVSATTADDAAFTTVRSGTLPNLDAPQDLVFDQLTDARYVQFVFLDGYFSGSINVRELGALALPGTGAVLLGTSSQQGTTTTPLGALDVDRANTGWITASGQTVDQWFKLALPEGGPWLVDQVALQPRSDGIDNQSPRDFELQLSGAGYDDASFVSVLRGTLRNNRQLQFFSFPPVSARYARLLVRNNYGGTNVGVQALWLISPQIGAPSARFLDRSFDPDGALAAYQWTFGDGGTDGARDAAHTFAAPGVYDVTLTALDDAGGSASRTLAYHVFGAPQAAFTFTPATPNEGQSVQFADATVDPLGLPALREWNWGDGTAVTSNTANPGHVFGDDGSFDVTLRVTSPRGISGSATRTVPVANVAPTANAGADKSVPWGVNWNTTSSVFDPGTADGSSLVCTWDFGDGQTATIANCTTGGVRMAHPYAQPGTYTARLTVRDKDGASASDEAVISVTKHATTLGACAPWLGVAGDQAEIEAVATLRDGDEPQRKLAGFPLTFTIAGQSATVLTDADGIARQRFTLAAGAQADVQVTYDGDALFVGASAASDARVGQVSRPFLPDTEGSEFWLAFESNYTGGQALTLFVTGSTTTSGRVSVPALGYCASFDVTAGQVTTVALPGTATIETSDGVEPAGVNVTVLEEVTIYGLNRLQFTTDAFLGLPLDILGTEHFIQSYGRAPGWGSQFAVAAAQDATTLTVTPAVTTGAHTAGVPYDVTLQRGQVYQLRNDSASTTDLSGSAVTSDKPVAVFGGNRCTYIPAGAAACDHIVEQLPPLATWGRRFLSVPLATRLNGDTFRFLASEDGTTVAINGSAVATLARGQFHERILTAPAEITADKPLLVMQYSNGSTFDGVVSDPFMMLIPPAEQYLPAYTLTTPATGFQKNFVNLVVPAEGASGVQVDGVAVPPGAFVPIGASGFLGAQVALAAGSHHVTATLPVGATMYGFDNYDSYGYPGGMSLAPVAEVRTVTLSPRSETSPVGVERCVDASVRDQNGAPLGGVRVDFSVSGANPGSGFGQTDAGGRAGFCYTGVNGGTDTIVGAVGGISDTVTKTWLSNRPPVADDQSVATPEDTPLPITLTGSDPDNDPLTFTLLTQPAHGTLSGTAPDLTYAPVADYHGPDAFTFVVNDGTVDSNVATVSISVMPVNDPPVADDQSVGTLEDTPLSITVTASDVEGDALTYTLVGGPLHGTLSGTLPGVLYTPALDYNGPDSFTFQVSDGQLDSNLATVSIAVVPANDAPVAYDQTVTTDFETPVPVTLAASDVDGDPLTYLVVTQPEHGTLSGSGADLTYTPEADYSGADAFTYKAHDGWVDSNVATVSITVNAPPNEPPDCTHAEPTVTVLWPPNHKWRALGIQGVTDPEGHPVSITLTGVRQDEPVNGLGDGDASPDATLSPLQVRSERSGTADGRVYHVQFTATDDIGLDCAGEVRVCVPHDQGTGFPCVDGGALYDSTQP